MKKRPILDENYIIPVDSLGLIVDFNEYFDRPGPLEVEIGVGKGKILLYLAQKYPERNFVGIEWSAKYYRYSADRMRRWGIKNVKMLRTDARELFIDRIKDESIDVVHIYFPDPWWKKRHHKRRLFIPEFCNAIFRTLKPKGKIYIATDYPEYYEQIRNNLLSVDGFKEVEYDSPEGTEVKTNYEEKWLKEGREIYRLAVQKAE